MRKLTPKQEKFCQAYVETGNASEAYRRAYDTRRMKAETVHRMAHEQLQHPKISARLDELREAARERHEMTVDRMTEMLLRDRELAREKGNAGAAVAACRTLAELHGLMVKKHEVTGKDGKPLAMVRHMSATEKGLVIYNILRKALAQQKMDESLTAAEALREAVAGGNDGGSLPS